ncbi:MAG: hypothetical protein LBL87_06100 [Ruminococcus sp.]|jgi:hypothetical protein|nr:hypothetical protein [Ruminococcus sp.]
MSTDIIFSENGSNDFDRTNFEVGIKNSFSDFAYYLKTRDRSKFKPLENSLREWKIMAEEIKNNKESGSYGTEYTGD